MPSGDEDETAERDALLLFELLLFELPLFEPLLFKPWLFEPWLFEPLLFVLITPVVARAFLVGANLYPTLFRK
ncbi:hypothetical protein [Bradyrhizobium sp. SSUT77]|uniref:hypothetical protein n=1 Tax=Bradyrhizobium sp. SSUT77 TaxID=3040603 RepID=UPI00244D3604|nr:hypothetical protein [Bradyrhizobium sp. SSUT77]MDH2344612.1 hypothetical protein [Bradyrhizobium sp. SSUT77]